MSKFKNVTFGLKTLTQDGEFEGYASTFNNVDLSGDMILPGAFADTLAEIEAEGRAIPVLLQHDQTVQIGGITSAYEDEKGLKVIGRILPELNEAASGTYALLKNGFLKGLSIGYRVAKDGAKNVNGVRQISKLNLFEISATPVPMDQFAMIGAVKSMTDIRAKLAAGDQLTVREWEGLFKSEFNLTNTEAERAVRVNVKRSQGDPGKKPGGNVLKELHAILNR